MMESIDNPIAERRLYVLGDLGRVVVVRIARPEAAPDMPEVWQCHYRVSGLDVPIAERGCGDDSIAALANALLGLRVRLAETGLRWAWPNGQERAVAIELVIPGYLSPEQVEEAERLALTQEAAMSRASRDADE